jgi:hypothetical protein
MSDNDEEWHIVPYIPMTDDERESFINGALELQEKRDNEVMRLV